jgi:hypothetical protein
MVFQPTPRALPHRAEKAYSIALLLFAICACPSADAASHYISSQATGSGTGADWSDAWRTFSSATWTRGDTYYVASGNYSEDVTISKPENGTQWIYLKKATAGAHGTDSGWDPSYGSGQAVVNGTLSVSNSYVDVDGMTGSDSSGHGIKVHYTGCDDAFNGKNVVFLGQGKDSIHLSHLEVEGCGYGTYDSVDGFYQNSLASNPSTDIQVTYCWIHDVSRNGLTLGGHQGTAYTEGNIGFLFENNRLEKTGGCTYPDWHGQGVQAGYGGIQDYIVFRNSRFIDIAGTGYIAYLGLTFNDHIRIYNNIFYSTDKGTFDASPGVITFLASGNSTKNVQIYNNVFCNISVKGVTNWVVNGTGNELKNNLFVNSHFTYGHLGFVSEYNDYFNNTGGGSVGVPTGEIGQQNESADPFVNSAGHDFHLRSGVNAIDNGADLSSVFTTDFDGVTRPTGSGWDIGAYEFPNQAPVLTSGNVSPTLGNPSTNFNFTVNYIDSDGDSPSFISLLLDGTTHDMTAAGSNFIAGAVYYYNTTILRLGTHSYLFNASDGNYSVATPAYSGPSVCTSSPSCEGSNPVNETVWSVRVYTNCTDTAFIPTSTGHGGLNITAGSTLNLTSTLVYINSTELVADGRLLMWGSTVSFIR